MGGNKTADQPRQDRAWVTAAEWFAGGQRIPYDPGSARVLTGEEAATAPGVLGPMIRYRTAPGNESPAPGG